MFPRRASADALCAALLVGVVAWFFAPLVRGEAIIVDRDALSAVLPVKDFLARALAARTLPWWNPAPSFGKPFLADPLPGTLYPGNLLLLVSPFERGYNLFLVAHYAWTALGAFLLLRAAGLPRAASLLGAVLWALGGALVSLANVVNHLSAAAWLPWVLWAWTRPRHVLAKLAVASLAMAMPALCGSPEMLLLAAAGLVLWSGDWRSLLVPPLALGLAAIEVVPILAFLGETFRGEHGIAAAAAMRFAASPSQLLQFVLRGHTVGPAAFLASVYVGIPAATLAVVGLLSASPRRRMLCAGLAAAIALLALGPHTPLFPWLFAHVPLAGLLRYPGKLLVALHGLIALGAAFGCARLLSLASGGSTALATRRGAALLGAALVALVLADLAASNRRLARGEPVGLVLTPPPAARAMLEDASRAAAGSNVAAGSHAAAAPGPPATLLRYFANPDGMPEAASPRDAVRLDRALLYAATGELYGLANANTPSSLNLVAHERFERALVAASRESALDALAALGVAYVTSWAPLEESAIAREIPLPAPGSSVEPRLYHLRDAAPRAFVARRVVVAGDALGALGRFVLSSAGNHGGLAVIEEADLGRLPAEVTAEREGPLGVPESPRWITDDGHHVELELRLDRPGLLVINDTYAPGWTAAVDGQATPIMRVNGLVRGVALPAGDHRLEMNYLPPGLALGLVLSLVSTGILLALLGAIRARAGTRRTG